MELLIVISLLAIVAGLALPKWNGTEATRVREAARLLAADLEYAQADAIAHPDAPRAVVFDTVAAKYWIAPINPTQPGTAPAQAAAISHPTDRLSSNPAQFAPYVVTVGTGRASGVAGVSLTNPQNLVTSGSLRFLAFDAYGAPLDAAGAPATAIAQITLSAGAASQTVYIDPGSGTVRAP